MTNKQKIHYIFRLLYTGVTGMTGVTGVTCINTPKGGNIFVVRSVYTRRVIFNSISNTKVYNRIRGSSREIQFYCADDRSDFEINLLINIIQILQMDSLHDVRDEGDYVYGYLEDSQLESFLENYRQSCGMFYGIHHKRSRINYKINLYFDTRTPVFEMK